MKRCTPASACAAPDENDDGHCRRGAIHRALVVALDQDKGAMMIFNNQNR
jgi:hypothetical protein